MVPGPHEGQSGSGDGPVLPHRFPTRRRGVPKEGEAGEVGQHKRKFHGIYKSEKDLFILIYSSVAAPSL